MTEAQSKARFNDMNTARAAILTDLKRRYDEKDPNVRPAKKEDLHRWYRPQPNYFSGNGIMKCPICPDGKLQYSRASYNGHVHACCTTPHCMNWME